MFTGIIRQKGRVTAVQPTTSGMRLAIEPERFFECAAGESIAVSGCCLTRLEGTASGPLTFDVVPETLRCTTLGALRSGDWVNLEPAVTPQTLLSGHIVQGHVDGVGTATRSTAGAGEVMLRIQPPPELIAYVIDKGSIAVDGVSLTVARRGADWFEIALIPATLAQTTLGLITATPRAVNLEVDYLAKIVVAQLGRAGFHAAER